MSLRAALFCLLALVFCDGCRRDMFDQPRSKTLRESDFFADGSYGQPLPPHTVARGHLDEDDAFYRGMNGTNLVETIPMPMTRAMLER